MCGPYSLVRLRVLSAASPTDSSVLGGVVGLRLRKSNQVPTAPQIETFQCLGSAEPIAYSDRRSALLCADWRWIPKSHKNQIQNHAARVSDLDSGEWRAAVAGVSSLC